MNSNQKRSYMERMNDARNKIFPGQSWKDLEPWCITILETYAERTNR